MPRAQVPYRAYFIGRTFVTWFDCAADGGQTWAEPVARQDLWPSLRDPFAVQPPPTRLGVYPVSATVLTFVDDAGNEQFVDVDKGSTVPDPRLVSAPKAFGRPIHVVSWDAGPILMVPDLMGTPNTVTPVDVRDYSMGPAQPINTPPGTPTIAIPGEAVRWFTDGTPQQVITNGPTPDALLVPPLPNGPGHVSEPLSQAFQQNLRTDDEIVDATIMYGGHSAALAVATAGLTDIEMRAVVGVAVKFAASGAQMLAMLYLLSGLRFDAYHPAGTYGIAAMTTEQLSAAGWDSAPELILGDTDQLGWLLSYLGTFPTWHADIVWPLAVLLSGQAVDDLSDTAVVLQAPYPPRLRGVAALDAEGAMGDVVTVGQLRAAIDGVLTGPLQAELTGRATGTTLA
jgi:hypothetical protein